MAQFFARMWDRAQGKLSVRRICDKVFVELADKDKMLLDINSLQVATLMVYNSINKQLVGPHKDPPPMAKIDEKIKHYGEQKADRITQQEFRDLILEWVKNDLRIMLANKAAVALLASPLLAVTAKNAGRQVPKVRDAVEKVPTPLLCAVFSFGLMLLYDVREGKQ